MSNADVSPNLTSTIAEMDTRPARPKEISRTVEYWLQTLFWTAAAMLVCSVAYCIERYGFGLKELKLPRMFGNPAEISMRIFGLPHFIVGLFFMLSAKRMRSASGWLWFFGLLALGLFFAHVFGRCGGHRNPVMLVAFYFYFLIHGFRDEAFFYKSYGDCPEVHSKKTARLLFFLQVMLISLLIAFIMPTYLQYLELKNKLPADDPVLNMFFPASVPFLLKFVTYFVPIVILNAGIYFLLARRYAGGWRAIWHDHHPLLVVFLISTGIVLATLVVGPWTFNFVVLAHFVGWYLFAIRKLESIPTDKRAPSSKPLAWMRTSIPGFCVMHLGLAVIVTILIAISVYVFKNQTWMDTVFGGPSFYYWTVLHVSLSFYPRA